MRTQIGRIESTSCQAAREARSGVLVEVQLDGRPIVDFPGNECGPIPARTTISRANAGDPVLLVFDGGDPTRPIIVGILRDHLEKAHPQRVNIAAREILLEGSEQVSLRCGESSLTLQKDGKAVLKGRDVVSRASRTNRVKGSTVQIN